MEFVQRWKTPESLLYTATRASEHALRASYRFGFQGISRDIVEEAAQDVICHYLALPDIDRPQTLQEYESYAFSRARHFMQIEVQRARRHISQKQSGHDGEEYDLIDTSFANSDSVCRHQKPTQFLHMVALDALKLIEKLPKADKNLVYSIIDYGSVAEFAKERRVSLFDAMTEIKRAREKMNAIERLCDEDFEDAKVRVVKPNSAPLTLLSKSLRDRMDRPNLSMTAIRWVWIGEPPYEVVGFRNAARRAWDRMFGDACPLCDHKMVIPKFGDRKIDLRLATIDHILARSLGGTNALTNLWVVCGVCNSAKGREEYVRGRQAA